MRNQGGFTLIELMITVALVAIVSAIAFQAYTGYTDTAEDSVLVNNIEGMRVFQEDVRLRTGSYVAGNFIHDDPADQALATDLGWEPGDDTDQIDYVAVLDGGGYYVTATGPTGQSVCRAFAGAACP